MGCNSCGKGQILRVERSGSARMSPVKIASTPRKLGSRKIAARTVATKPANDLDKHRA
jgi:hypothetical protein